MKRQRGRGRKGNGQANRHFESNGPDIKIRGSASHIYEKYQQLARDATSSGDRVMAENYLQHAEHYYRIVQTNQKTQRDRTEDTREFSEETPAETAEVVEGEAASSALEVVTPEAASELVEEPPAEQPPAERRPRRTRRPRAAAKDSGETADSKSKGGDEAALDPAASA